MTPTGICSRRANADSQVTLFAYDALNRETGG